MTNDITQMRVMWVSQLHCDNGTYPAVQVGTTSGHYTSIVYGTSATYTIPPRWWGQFNGQIHNVRIQSLILSLCGRVVGPTSAGVAPRLDGLHDILLPCGSHIQRQNAVEW